MSRMSLSEVAAELQQMCKEHGLGSMYEAEDVFEISEMRRIGDSLDRIADCMEAGVKDREKATDLCEQIVKVFRGAMAAHFNLNEVAEAAQKACESPERPTGDDSISFDGCTS